MDILKTLTGDNTSMISVDVDESVDNTSFHHQAAIKQELVSTGSAATPADLFVSSSSKMSVVASLDASKHVDDSLDDEEDKPDLLQMIVDDEIKQFL